MRESQAAVPGASTRAHVPPSSIPWAALRALLATSIYGGRVDNDFDRALLAGLVDQLFVPAAFDADFPLVQRWAGPSGMVMGHFALYLARRAL